MSIRYFCYLLVTIIVSMETFAIDSRKNLAGFNASTADIWGKENICKFKLNFENLPRGCKELDYPAEGRFGLVMQASGEATLTSLPAFTESDDFELLCYRCAFNKEKDRCGRYAKVWNKPEQASKCPKLD